MNVDKELDRINDINEWLGHLELLKHNDPYKKIAVNQSIEMWKLEITAIEGNIRTHLEIEDAKIKKYKLKN